MKTLTGKEFKLKVLGSGFSMKQVYNKAKVSSTAATHWVNERTNITATYDKLINAYLELQKEGEE